MKLISKSLNASHCLSKDETVYILNEKRDWVVSSGDRGKYGAKGKKTNVCPWKANTSAIAPSGSERGTYLRKYSQLVNLQHVYRHDTFEYQLSTCITNAK